MNNSVILQQFAFQRQYLSMLVDDVADEQMSAQPGGVVNHPAWQLGHLAHVSDRFTKMLGGASTLDEAWGKKFGPGSIPSSNRADYPAKAELMRIVDERRGVLARTFEQTTPDDLAKPNPIARISAQLPTMGHLVLFGMAFHEGTHLGQLATWRKAMGLPMALSKLGS